MSKRPEKLCIKAHLVCYILPIFYKTCLWSILLKIPNRSPIVACLIPFYFSPVTKVLIMGLQLLLATPIWSCCWPCPFVASTCKRWALWREGCPPAETQLNTAVIKRLIKFQTTSSIISETVWSSNAFSLAGLPQGEYLLYPASLHILSPVQVSSEC